MGVKPDHPRKLSFKMRPTARRYWVEAKNGVNNA